MHTFHVLKLTLSHSLSTHSLSPFSLSKPYAQCLYLHIPQENGDTFSNLWASNSSSDPSPPPLPVKPYFDLGALIIGFSFVFMGAGISSYAGDSHGGYPPLKPSISDIPESCIASVLMYLDPPEICKLARLNRTFRGASSADFVWESKLPSNYKFLFQKVFDEIPESLSKKEIYARLCRPNRFDGGTKEVWLEKSSGGVCFAISSKALRITGIDDRRYWNHIPTDESRFPTIAYLQQIWWLEVDGELEFQIPTGTYSLFFRLQLGKPSKRLGRRVCNLDQVHGWDIKPVQFQLSTSNGQRALSQCYLSETGNWVHHHVGDFIIDNPITPMKIKFSMIQIDCTHTKGGLCVDSVLIYPSERIKKL